MNPELSFCAFTCLCNNLMDFSQTFISTSPMYALHVIPYSYKFSRDVNFADATNSAFSQFYFRGSQDFVLVRTIIKYKFSKA